MSEQATGRPPACRRARQAERRCRTVRLALSDQEHADLTGAATAAELACAAYAARAALTAARAAGPAAEPGDQLRDVLSELIRAAGQVRRIGINLNQAVARLNATGLPAGDLEPAAAEAVRRARHLDEVAEHVRRAIP
jgi:hypothetical protein